MWISCLVTFCLVLTGQLLGRPVDLFLQKLENDAVTTAGFYFSFIGIWVVTVVFLLLVKRDSPILQKIGPKEAGNRLSFLLLGVGVGFALNGICVLAAVLHKDIALYFDRFEILSVLLIFAAVFVQSSAEELVCRGFLYQKILRGYENPLIAVLGNSALFALLHLGNDGVTVLSVINIMLSGILFSLFVWFWDSIWCAMAIHTMWNFTQNIIFGLPNSGIVLPYSIWKLDAGRAVNSFAYNVGFGVEGTGVADLVLFFACVVVYLIGVKTTKKNLFTKK